MRNPLYLALLSIPTVLGVALAGPAAAAEAPCPVPKALRFEVEGKIVRDRVGLTQGLEFHDGKLFESTGRTEGETRLNTVGLDGKVTVLDDLGTAVFGEGLAILNGEVFQLTWQEHVVFVYDLSGKLLRKMTNPRLGWGLASDGKSLIFTDGEGALHYADPKTFKLTRSIPLRAAAASRRSGSTSSNMSTANCSATSSPPIGSSRSTRTPAAWWLRPTSPSCAARCLRPSGAPSRRAPSMSSTASPAMPRPGSSTSPESAGR